MFEKIKRAKEKIQDKDGLNKSFLEFALDYEIPHRSIILNNYNLTIRLHKTNLIK